MKICKLILFISVLGQLAFAANSLPEKSIVSQQIQTVEETEYKPWSINMGYSNITANLESRQMSGRGVTLNLQRALFENFEIGAAFTNYALNNEIDGITYYGPSKRHTSIIDAYAEFQPIHIELMEGVSFTAAINGGVGYITEGAYDQSPVFYGIGAGFDFNRQIGIRADLKTYLSRANANTVSLIGYF